MTDLFEQKPIRALSWKEPFASLMLLGKIETRTWPTKYRGRVLICASKSPYTNKQLKDICTEAQAIFNPFTQMIYTSFAQKTTNGHAIAVGNLVDCRKMNHEDEEKCMVKFNPDLWCHVYENVQAIKPIPWKGTQGWKKLPLDFEYKIIGE